MLPGWLISLLTFPGVIAHEFGHQFFCRLFRVPVFKVCYFRFGNPAGYVQHEEPQHFAQSFFITVGPFIVNNLLAVGAFVCALSVVVGDTTAQLVFGWLGFSFAMHSFPSTADAKNLWAMTWRHTIPNIFLMLVALPFVAIIYVANLLRYIWFDLIWAVFLYAFVDTIILQNNYLIGFFYNLWQQFSLLHF